MSLYIAGLDLGQAQDYSALVIVEQQHTPPAQPAYEVRFLHRWELGTAYPVILRTLEGTLRRPPLPGRTTLLVDYTGVGRAFVDQVRQIPMACEAIAIHGGVNTSHVGMNWSVPKRDLVGSVQLLLQQQRLRFAEQLPLTATLTSELLTFKVTLDPQTAHDSYSAWRERDHDDLVLALALAVWWGKKEQRSRVPLLDLSKGLQGLHKPSHWRDPMASPRPRLPGRLWRDEDEDL